MKDLNLATQKIAISSRALHTALEIVDAVSTVNQQAMKRSGRHLGVHIGIGTGMATEFRFIVEPSPTCQCLTPGNLGRRPGVCRQGIRRPLSRRCLQAPENRDGPGWSKDRRWTPEAAATSGYRRYTAKK
jgi:hypothetical protein